MLGGLFRFIYLYEDFISILLVYMALFGAKFKYSKLKTGLISLGIVFTETILSVKVGDLYQAIMLVFFAFMGLFLFKGKKTKWSSLFLPLYIFISVMQTIFMMFYSLILKNQVINSDIQRCLIGLPVILILLVIILAAKPAFDTGLYSWKQYLVLYLGSFSMFFILALAQAYFKGNNVGRIIQTGAGSAVYGALLSICFLLCFMSLYVGLMEKKARESKNKVYEQEYLMRAQSEQIKTIEQSEKSMRAFKHDLIAHLNALSSLADEGDMKKVKDYCDRLIGDTDAFKKVSYTGNAAIDGVLWRLKDMAEDRNIQLDIKMVVPREKNITDYDLCILISNILKNAIEANEDGGKIEIATWPFNNNICILQSNTTDYPLEYRNGKLISNKTGRDHGFGMRNIQAVVDKYDGSFDISYEDGLVKVEAMI